MNESIESTASILLTGQINGRKEPPRLTPSKPSLVCSADHVELYFLRSLGVIGSFSCEANLLLTFR
jgi:hypothetical protein